MNQIGQMGQALAPQYAAFDKMAGSIAPNQIAPDSATNLVMLIEQQTAELIQRTASIATVISGSIPAAQETGNVRQGPNNLIEHLQQISRGLSLALSEAERASRSL